MQYSFFPSSEECLILQKKDRKLAEAIRLVGDLKYNLHPNTEAFFIETIIGQMLSSSVADAITARLAALCGGIITATAITQLEYEQVKSVGISGQKAEYIMLFSERVIEQPQFLDELACKTDEEIMRELTSMRGIGNWTAKMYLIFVLNRYDVLPFEDGAFMQAYKWLYRPREISPKAVIRKCKNWHPYESIAARFLYRVLDYGMTKYKDIEDAKENWRYSCQGKM